MARSRFIVNQLDLTNTQSPQSVMLIDTNHTGIAIGSATPTVNKINIGAWGDYPNGIDFNAGNGAGFNFYMMNSSGAIFHVGNSNGVQIVDDGQVSNGFQVNLTGSSPIEMRTSSNIILLRTTASSAPIVIDSHGDNMLYSQNGSIGVVSYKAGIYLYNSPIADTSSEIRLQNDALGGNIVIQGNGIVDIVSASVNDSALRLRSTNPAGCVDIISDLDIRLTATRDIILSAGRKVIIIPTLEINGLKFVPDFITPLTSPFDAYLGQYIYVCDTSSGNVIVNLPVIDGVMAQYGTTFMIKNVYGTSGGIVYVNGGSGQTIDGLTTQDLSQGESIQIVAIYNGSYWFWTVI